MIPKKRKKKTRAPSPSTVCSSCGRSALRLVAETHPRICSECHTWPPDPAVAKPVPKKEKRQWVSREKS